MPVLIYLIIILNIAIISEVNAQIKLQKVSEKMVYVFPPFKECHASTIIEVEKKNSNIEKLKSVDNLQQSLTEFNDNIVADEGLMRSVG